MTFKIANRLLRALSLHLKQRRPVVRNLTLRACCFAAVLSCVLPADAQQIRSRTATQDRAESSTPLSDPRLSQLLHQQSQQNKQRRPVPSTRAELPRESESASRASLTMPRQTPPAASSRQSGDLQSASVVTSESAIPESPARVRSSAERLEELRKLEQARIQQAAHQTAEADPESANTDSSVTQATTALRATPTIGEGTVAPVNAMRRSELAATPEHAAEPEMFLDLSREKPPTVASASGSPRASSAGEGPEVTMDGNPTHVLTRAVAWIVIALCLFSLAALGVRHWQRQRGLLPTSGARSRVLETLSLGPGRSVSLIEMAGHRALVAFDSSGIKQLVLTPSLFQDELSAAETHESQSELHTMKHDIKVVTEL